MRVFLRRGARRTQREVLVSHEDVADFGVHAAERMSVVQNVQVVVGPEKPFNFVAQDHPLGGSAEEDMTPGFVRLRLECDANGGNRVHGFGQPVDKPVAHGEEIDPERVLVSVDTRPHDGEVGVEFLPQGKGLFRPFDRFSTDVGEWVGEGAPLKLLVPEEEGMTVMSRMPVSRLKFFQSRTFS